MGRRILMSKIKIYLGVNRTVTEAELVEDRPLSVLVRLDDGKVIKRKKSTQVAQEGK